MKEIYQSSVKEVLGQMGSREEGLTIKEVGWRFFWSSTRISW